MTIHIVRLKAPGTLEERSGIVGDYDLDGVAIEYDDETRLVDFRLQLGEGYYIYAALPAAPCDRLRLFLMDCAVAHVDGPEVHEDPFLFDCRRLEWIGTHQAPLGTFPTGVLLTRVIFESILATGSHRFEAHLESGDGESRTVVLMWSGGASSTTMTTTATSSDPVAAEEPSVSEKRARDLVLAVQENPMDDELRLVCADALSEIGDPRGELALLESPGSPTAFVNDHRHVLLQGLKDKLFIDDVRFYRGFVDRITLRPPCASILLGEPLPAELATVRAIELIDLPTVLKGRIVEQLPFSNLRALREIVSSSPSTSAFTKHTPEVARWLAERITRFVCVDDTVHSFALNVIEQVFPRLTHLGVRWTMSASTTITEIEARFKQFGLDSIFLAKLPHLEEVSLVISTRLQGFSRRVFQSLSHLNPHVSRVHMDVGPEGYRIERIATSDRFRVTIVSNDDTRFDPLLAREALKELPPSIELLTNPEVNT